MEEWLVIINELSSPENTPKMYIDADPVNFKSA